MNEYTKKCYLRVLRKAYKVAKKQLEEQGYLDAQEVFAYCYDFSSKKKIRVSIRFEETDFNDLPKSYNAAR